MKVTMLLACILLAISFKNLYAQQPDYIYDANIKTPLLYPVGNPLGMPIIKVNSAEKLELHFDDLAPGYKNYFYCLQLCNADWTAAILNPFEYFKGFFSSRISTYRNSNVALVKYTHYSATIPENNSMPTKSGNYLLKVYLNNDTSKLAFTKRVLVLDNKVSFGVNFAAPFNGSNANMYQKMPFTLNYNNLNVSDINQQLKVKVIPNNCFTESKDVTPTFIRQKSIEYSNEADILFAGGNEWRYVDLRSFRLQSDRIQNVNATVTPSIVTLKTDADRSTKPFVYFNDLNGAQVIELLEPLSPFWQGEYAQVNFSYMPANKRAINYGDVYIYGAFTNFKIDDAFKMSFNPNTGNYEYSQLLKQGFYNYRYVIVDDKKNITTNVTEGNFATTENNYTILAYFRSFSGRHDELIGLTNVNTYNFDLFKNNIPRINTLLRR